MRLLLHAGIHRTGSTSLQAFLEGNRAALAAQGISYPGQARNHQGLIGYLADRREGAREVANWAEAVPSTHTVILSAEDFCTLTDLRWLKDLTRSFEVRAFFYLRRQDHWVMSWYNQHVKWPFSKHMSQMDHREFLGCIGDFHWLDYAALLDRWSGVLGRHRVEAAVVEPGQVEDVVGDFVQRADIAPEGLDFTIPRANESLPVHALPLARHLGLFDLPPRMRIRINRALRECLRTHATPAKTLYTPAERREILRRFEASNRKVAKTRFGRKRLFLEADPDDAEPYYAVPELSRGELLQDWIRPVVRGMLEG